MNLAGMTTLDIAGMVLGFVFTLLVFTYLLGDNPLFRLTLSIFIGVATGFATVVAFNSVLLNQLVFPLIQNPAGSAYLLVPPLILGIWLFFKGSSRLARFGNPVMAYLVGAGAATALGGGLLGTLFPQIGAATSVFDLSTLPSTSSLVLFLLEGGVILVGTITTLLYFHFSVQVTPERGACRPPWLDAAAKVGEGFIAVSFGVLFAGVYASSLTALVERLRFVVDTILLFVPLR